MNQIYEYTSDLDISFENVNASPYRKLTTLFPPYLLVHYVITLHF